ncbi:hypothetical protein FHL15_007626 [Xylaria flabelliformis]|uniref:Uncharacterized protein n=1 Tax=Xylaria flabelliformis TaxID=2512241 RepID=A0A553HTW7_9PEZI|nr:hypothetical protein FHL15_007626 [Xylaria flabelliformis]
MKGHPNLALSVMGWWWEMGATVLSLTNLSLIITLLMYIDDAPLSDWPLLIQPNSLLAVLTTAMKTSMPVSVTSCIGQLKWRHFETRGRSIHELESLDDASRGPWGAFMLIITLRARSLMSICLAISSLLALGLEPSTQRNITVPDDSALTSRAEAYFSAGDECQDVGCIKSEVKLPVGRSEIEVPDNETFEGHSTKVQMDSLDMQKAFNGVLAGSVRGPYYRCPEIASRCIWDDFSTLAICSHFQNVTETVSKSCDFGSDYSKPSGSRNVTCTYQYPDDTAFTKGIPYNSPHEFTNIFEDGVFRFAETIKRTDVNSTATIASLWVVKINPNLALYIPQQSVDFNSSTTFLQAFESYFTHIYESYGLDFYWCNKTFRDITTSGSGLTAELVASIPWKSCNQLPEETDENEPQCYYWSKSIPTTVTLDPSPIPYLYSSGPVSQYNISLPIFDFMISYIQNLKEDLLEFLYRGGVNVEATTADMAAALTEYMLRPQGNNVNVTTVTGYIIVSEAYIHTEWIWFLLPIFEVLFTVFLLIVTIIISRHRPILKNSVLALLIHGLSGWSRNELQVPEPKQPGTLERLMREQRAIFKRDQHGEFKFNKVDRRGR